MSVEVPIILTPYPNPLLVPVGNIHSVIVIRTDYSALCDDWDIIPLQRLLEKEVTWCSQLNINAIQASLTNRVNILTDSSALSAYHPRNRRLQD